MHLYRIPFFVILLACPILSAAEPVDDSKETGVVFRISKELILRHQAPDFDMTSPINMCLFGANVGGMARTTGKTTVTMDANEKDAVFTLRFQGSTVTTSVASRQRVNVYGNGRTDFVAMRNIRFDGIRFKAEPAAIEASGNHTVDSIQAPRGLFNPLVRRVASNEVYRLKPTTDAIGLAEVKKQVLSGFEAESEKRMNQLNGIVPYESTLAQIAPKTQGWITHLGTSKNYLIISPGKADASIATLPADAKNMRAPMELWIRGRPEGEPARNMLEAFTKSQRALDRFRAVITGKERKLEGVAFTAVGDWWVLKIGEDLADQWLEKIEQGIQAEKKP